MSGGTKNDSGKPMMRFLTREFLEQTAQAHTYGAKKYGDFNFKNGLETLRLYDACLRHLIAWADGEDVDSESGDTHLGHAAANLNMLMWMLANKPELDNRSVKNTKPEVIEFKDENELYKAALAAQERGR